MCVKFLPFLFVAASANCNSSMDCQLNGECVNRACLCDSAWAGEYCDQLDIDNGSVVYGYGITPNTSSWGGGPPVYDPISKQYHLFVTELAGNCGMGTWSRMSTAAHAVANSLEGPYERVGLAVPAQCHNVYYAYSPPDKKHLIYHIGTGGNPQSCNPEFKCTNGTTPGCHGLSPPPTPSWPKPTCWCTQSPFVHSSSSLSGPWEPEGPIKIGGPRPPTVCSLLYVPIFIDACKHIMLLQTAGTAGGDSNPAPLIFPNGTVLLMGRGPDAKRFPNNTGASATLYIDSKSACVFAIESMNTLGIHTSSPLPQHLVVSGSVLE
jgi:hypothetical protein